MIMEGLSNLDQTLLALADPTRRAILAASFRGRGAGHRRPVKERTIAMKATPSEWHNESEQRASDYGVVTEPATVRIERLLPGPIERVWAYLTESEKRGKWFASGPMELCPGGRVELHFQHANLSPQVEQTPERFKKYEAGETSYGQVTRCEPPLILSYKWGEEVGDDSEVTFELTPRGDEVLLVVTHRRLHDRKAMVSVAGGWHAHLGILIDHLNGREPKPFWSTYERLEAEYDKRFPSESRADAEKS